MNDNIIAAFTVILQYKGPDYAKISNQGPFRTLFERLTLPAFCKRFNSSHHSHEVETCDFFDIGLAVATLSHLFENHWHLGYVFQTFRGDIDSVEVGSDADVVNTGDAYGMVNMVNNSLV